MITLLKAKQNNLKSINVNIPDNRIIVVTGVSGSGKSSLVYDIIFQEARRRYLETFSTNARQFMGKLQSPDVEYIMGLSPAIALEQKSVVKNPLATVGTLSEMYDLLRLLFARLGKSNITNEEFEINKNLFSYQSKIGTCTHCKGIGEEDAIDLDLLISDKSKSIRNGAFKMITSSGYIVYSQVTMEVLNQVCESEGFSVDIAWENLTDKQKGVVLYGSKKIKVPFGKHALESRMNWSGITAKPRGEDFYKGIIPIMDEILKRDRNSNILKYASTKCCSHCKGTRLNDKALSVLVDGKTISELTTLSISDLLHYFISNTDFQQGAAKAIADELVKIGRLIEKLGLGYLSLDRSAMTLSGGETQRLRLVKQVASKLRGILYVFDEPSVGLHPKDAQHLMDLFWELRAQGNTVMLVEHNAQIIKQSDWIIDLGPDAGTNGGYILFNGPVKKFLEEANPGNSKTHEYLNRELSFKETKSKDAPFFELKGVRANNLKNIDVKFQLNALNLLSGVSGAGKTSLLNFSLEQAFKNEEATLYESIHGAESLKNVVKIDQSPIGKTPRSNPATYIALSDDLRNLFSALDEAKAGQFSKSHFSFNTKAGRCDKCEGSGYLQMGMQLLGTVEVLCSKCHGQQFSNEVLTLKYKKKSLADIYAMTVDESLGFFTEEHVIISKLEVLKNLGLGYMKLNQRSSTLSGGEARRIKLAKALLKPANEKTLYLMDEPSSGLHPFDMEVLQHNLNALIALGHTIILVEHQEWFIKQADYLIDLGPGSGEKGGQLLFQGSPSEIVAHKDSYTGKALNNEFSISKHTIAPNVINNKPIVLKGVETHNLKKIAVEIPFNKLTVISGISGSGKSSLAFDTLFMEGRQQFAESFSTYARTRLNINSKAKFEEVDGMFPTLAVNQKSVAQNRRSTVGTMTGVYDKMRLLYSRIGTHPDTDKKQSASDFSFNHEQGACPQCQGLGSETICDVDQLISYPDKAIIAGAMDGTRTGKFYGDVYGQYVATIKAVGKCFGIDYSKAWEELSAKDKRLVLDGTGDESYDVVWEFKRNSREGSHEFSGKWQGLNALVQEEYLRKAKQSSVKLMHNVLKQEDCPICEGGRLKKQSTEYQIKNYSIIDMVRMPIIDLLGMLRKWVVFPAEICDDDIDRKAVQIILGHILNGLDLLNQLGLGYLTLERTSKTLSGGEGQRVRLAASINMELRGLCVILDEPTAGLHSRDTESLWHMLKELLVQGNTVVVIEHDPDFIKRADYVIDMGPEAGVHGGQVVAHGTVDEIKQNPKSISGKYLSDHSLIFRTKKLLSGNKVQVEGASANNLKNINVEIPLGGLVCLMGISGSGKSSLLHEVLYQSWIQQKAVASKLVKGLDYFDQVVYTQQKADKVQGKASVFSFLAIADKVAKIYAAEAKAMKQAFNKSYFLPNSQQGKCNTCKGKGVIITALDFLSDYEEVCEACEGRGFSKDLEFVKHQGYSISDLMKFELAELDPIFNEAYIQKALLWAKQLGLSYLKPGQLLNSLSGGEVQRLNVLKTLLNASDKPTLFLMDEPTTGLHMEDVKHLIKAFDLLIEQGHSLLVVEHHLAIIQNADLVIEMGPGAGEKGGEITGIVNQ